MADCTAGAQLLERLPPCRILHGDKGYDTDAIRRQVEATGAMPNIPPKANRRWKNCFSPALYRGRNAIERMFCRLKDFRRVATRYDRLATNFLAAVCIAATVSYWFISPDPNAHATEGAEDHCVHEVDDPKGSQTFQIRSNAALHHKRI